MYVLHDDDGALKLSEKKYEYLASSLNRFPISDVNEKWIKINAGARQKLSRKPLSTEKNSEVIGGEWLRRSDVVLTTELSLWHGCWPVVSMAMALGDAFVTYEFQRDGNGRMSYSESDGEESGHLKTERVHIFFKGAIFEIRTQDGMTSDLFHLDVSSMKLVGIDSDISDTRFRKCR